MVSTEEKENLILTMNLFLGPSESASLSYCVEYRIKLPINYLGRDILSSSQFCFSHVATIVDCNGSIRFLPFPGTSRECKNLVLRIFLVGFAP